MQQTIDELLHSEAHIIEIKFDEEHKEYSIDYAKFEPSQKTEIERVIKILTNYLKTPSIIDDFKEHDDRRIWRDELCKKYGADFRTQYDKNSLRMNCISAISINLEFFFYKKQPYAGDKQEMFYQLTEDVINACHPKGGYGTKTTQEKLEIVAEIKQEIKELLEFLSAKNSR